MIVELGRRKLLKNIPKLTFWAQNIINFGLIFISRRLNPILDQV